jgi:hypothetical protein
MVSHGAVPGAIARLAALTVATLLAVSGLAPIATIAAAEPASFSEPGSSMAAPEGPQASAVLSAAPSIPAAPLSATSRVVVAFAVTAARLPARSSVRLAGAMRPAPAILRV